jgi:hypothetical protein
VSDETTGRWRHVKGVRIAPGDLQAAANIAVTDKTEMVIYQSADGQLWVLPADKFESLKSRSKPGSGTAR